MALADTRPHIPDATDGPRTAPRFLRTETVVFLGLFFLFMMLGRDKVFTDPGSLWHVVVGQRILSTGELIRTDPFSFTAAAKPWLSQAWLFDVGVALLYRVAGLSAILLVHVTIVCALFAWLARRARRAGIHPLIAVLIAGWALFASSYNLHPRPNLLTIVLIGWTFARLCDFEAGRISLRGLAWLVPAYVLWTNIHGGVPGGVAMLVAAAAGWGLAGLLGWQTPLTDVKKRAGFIAITLACALTPLVNPYGPGLLPVWFGLMGSSVLPRTIMEHLPLMQTGTTGLTVVSFALLYLAALVGTLPARPRLAWLMPLVWLALTWTRIRYGPLFAVTAAISLAEMFPHVRWVAWLARKGSVTCVVQPPSAETSLRAAWRPALIPALVVFSAAILQLAAIPVPVLGAGWAQLDPEHWPLDLLPELRAYQQSRPKGTPVFNDMFFGGFLIYFTPDLRVFIDDRCELYGDQGIEDYADAFRNHPERIEQWADHYGLDLALVQAGEGFDPYLRTAAGWKEVGRTRNAALYRRVSAAPDGPAPESTGPIAVPRASTDSTSRTPRR
jgi:hypothetical protein